MPEFQPRTLQRLAVEKTEPRLATVLASTDEQGRAMAIEEILKLGIGALPAVLETIDTSHNEAAIADLRELARKLSTTVTKFAISDDSAPMTADLDEQLEKFEGRRLSDGQLIELLLSVANDLPQGSTGIKISVQRVSITSGVETMLKTAFESIHDKPFAIRISLVRDE